MYTINETKKFKRAIKQIKKSGNWKKIEPHYNMILDRIKSTGKARFDNPDLNKRYNDHDISGGNEKGTRDVHIRPDLILVYINRGNNVIDLLHIGSHAATNVGACNLYSNSSKPSHIMFKIQSKLRLISAAKLGR